MEKNLYADPRLSAYRRGKTPIPKRYWLWPLYGAGFENLGVNDKPIQVDTPTCGPDQLLVRHDAVGLCFSDIKVIKTGEEHPRLTGRDMKTNPVVLGHEVALTVIQVGENLTGKFKPGDRFIVQADIYYKGVGLAYGYALQGGLSQFNLIGKEILEGDEGCYLIPVQTETGYAQAALTEPWACVLASYHVTYRTHWQAGGQVLIAAGPGARGDYQLGNPYEKGQAPALVVTTGVEGPLLQELKSRAEADGFTLLELDSPGDLESQENIKGFDDIILLGADEPLYERLEAWANKGCVFNLVGAQAFSTKAQVDVGRLHYDHIYITGTPETTISAAYTPLRNQLLPGGYAIFIGAAGPMGQMHVQRALQLKDSPQMVVATDLVPERLAVIERKYAQLIENKRAETRVILRTPNGQPPDEFNRDLVDLTNGHGFDDIVVLAPSTGVVAGAMEMIASKGVMNIFAGLPRGSKAPIDLRLVVEKGIRFKGTSGSSIDDLRTMLHEAESGRLDPNLSVAAVSGFNDAKKGLEGVAHQQFPGKVVIYPQILDFPLTLLSDLKKVLPNVYAKLGPNETWTVEAEAEFLKELLP